MSQFISVHHVRRLGVRPPGKVDIEQQLAALPMSSDANDTASAYASRGETSLVPGFSRSIPWLRALVRGYALLKDAESNGT
ncbi:hypothetical protein D3C76_854150 [compost metagenome]